MGFMKTVAMLGAMIGAGLGAVGNRLGMSLPRVAVAKAGAAAAARPSLDREAAAWFGRSAWRTPGLTPKDWGMSQACRRMVRSSRLRARGLGGARI